MPYSVEFEQSHQHRHTRAALNPCCENGKICPDNASNEDRKRVLGIIAGILVARHLKTTEGLLDTRDSPRTRSMVIAGCSGRSALWQKLMRSAEGNEENIAITSSGPLFLPHRCHLLNTPQRLCFELKRVLKESAPTQRPQVPRGRETWGRFR